MPDFFEDAPDDLPSVPPLDLPRLLDALNRHRVDHVIVGGFAVIAHGNPRATFDLDISVALARENLERLAVALRELDARVYAVDGDLLDVDPTDPDDLAAGANRTLVTSAGRLDLLPELPGAPPYDDLREQAVEFDADAGHLVVAGFEHLVRMKQASGRDKDLADIAALHRVRGIEAPTPRRPPAPPPTGTTDSSSSPDGEAICSTWMPIARARCGRSLGHEGRHCRR